MSSYPSIPEPGGSLESLRKTLVSVKEALEILIGDRDRTSLGAPRLYLQIDVPVRPNVGDLWIKSDMKCLNYYSDRKVWEEIQ